MAKKKGDEDLPKTLVVRTTDVPNRNRAGYSFNTQQQFIDVEKQGLTAEDVKAILDDPSLSTTKNAPKGDYPDAIRRDSEGREWVPGATQIGNSTLETATDEMVEAAKRGEQPPPHPSAVSSVQPDVMTPEAARALIDRVEPTAAPAAAKGDKKIK